MATTKVTTIIDRLLVGLAIRKSDIELLLQVDSQREREQLLQPPRNRETAIFLTRFSFTDSSIFQPTAEMIADSVSTVNQIRS